MEIEKAFKTVWIVEVLSPEKLGAHAPLRDVIERITAGDYAASLIVIEGGTFTGPDEIAGALEDLDIKGNYAQDGEREPEPAEDAHLDAPKYPERPGGENWDGRHLCDVCLASRDDCETKPFVAGTAYMCDGCDLHFTQPNVVRDMEAP